MHAEFEVVRAQIAIINSSRSKARVIFAEDTSRAGLYGRFAVHARCSATGTSTLDFSLKGRAVVFFKYSNYSILICLIIKRFGASNRFFIEYGLNHFFSARVLAIFLCTLFARSTRTLPRFLWSPTFYVLQKILYSISSLLNSRARTPQINNLLLCNKNGLQVIHVNFRNLCKSE